MNHDDLLPVRALNAVTFCPRLYWYEYVEGVFEPNAHTLEGDHAHRRVDRPGGEMSAPPDPDNAQDDESDDTADTAAPWHTRALWLSDESLGISGKIDLVEEYADGTVMPVDTKKGCPTEDGEMWPADLVQITSQALLSAPSHGRPH